MQLKVVDVITPKSEKKHITLRIFNRNKLKNKYEINCGKKIMRSATSIKKSEIGGGN